jgi:hypothetical protein
MVEPETVSGPPILYRFGTRSGTLVSKFFDIKILPASD